MNGNGVNASMTEIQTYEDALNFIHSRPRFRKRPTLERMTELLRLLGNPQEGLKYVHITGTNGKGSTTAFVRSLLSEHGLNVGTFTSPFITRFNERIQLDGQPISDPDLIKYTQQVAHAAAEMEKDGQGPTEFETDTAIMFAYFHDCQPDIVILEVGIGGRWDSTNVIASPLVAAIVTVGYDHMKYLGTTLADIADQKSGIIKDGTTVVVGQLPDAAMTVVAKNAAKHHARLLAWGRDFKAKLVNAGQLYPCIDYQGPNLPSIKAKLGLAGDYQLQNASCALTIMSVVLSKLGLPVDLVAVKQGLEHLSWPGRMEVVNDEPLMILDGAHNLPGMQALTKTLRDDFTGRDIYVLLAVLADKQAELMLGELASLGNVHIFLTRFAGPYGKRHSVDWHTIASQVKTHYPLQIIDDWQVALLKLSQELSADDVLLATGSLYFISDLRHLLLDD